MQTFSNLKWRRHEGFQIYCSDELSGALRGSGFDYRKWLEENMTTVKSNKKKESGRIVWPDQRIFFYKKFPVDSFLQKFACLFFRNHAERTFRLSLKLIKAGISVPYPAAIIRNFSQGSVYYICEALSSSLTLSNHIKAIRSYKELKNIIEYFAFEIGQFHKSGFFHGDMNWKNIILVPEPERKPYYIDLDTAGELLSTRDTRFAMDLARFCIDIADKTSDREYIPVFLKAYSRATGVSPNVLVSFIRPYHRKIAAKHKTKYGSNIASLNLNP